MEKHPFVEFLNAFIPQIARKSKQVNQAVWLLETTGSNDAADLRGCLDVELKWLFDDAATYQKLLEWEKELKNPLLQRQINVLIRAFKQNQIPKELSEEISQKEALLSQSYGNFRAELEGKKLSENEILELLKKEINVEKRKKAWEVSKTIGKEQAPQILSLVRLRNRAAQHLGYSDYFQMQLDLQEVDEKWLFTTLEKLALQSDAAYLQILQEIEEAQAIRFHVEKKDLGPWAWSDPFCQENPLDCVELDQLVKGVDLSEAGLCFYRQMGFDVEEILKKSDMYEHPGKNQHAFCIHMDREGDIRTLNNVKESIKWLETVLHELGHAVYELGFDPNLPWLLKDPPHMISTEAMALIAGRQAYSYHALKGLVGSKDELLLHKAEKSLKRRQLIFSRWVLVMTMFERELYSNPEQDLNRLWWHLVETYQKIRAPKGREGKWDWAAKYHIGLAPVYYFSYLLGEMFASAIQEAFLKECGKVPLNSPEVGAFLKHRLFEPGSRFSWSKLVEHVTGKALTSEAWIKEFAK